MGGVAGIIGASHAWNMANISSDLTDQERVRLMVRSMLPEAAFDDDQSVMMPPLPYDWNRLQPYYDPLMLQLHYHQHRRVVRLLNVLMSRSRDSGGKSGRMESRMLLDAASEHVLHCMFWESMSVPRTAPGPQLSAAIDRDLGSHKKAMDYFASLCTGTSTRGWGIMGYNSRRDRVVIFFTGELVNLLSWPVRPILVCDLWEHAYVWQYGSDRRRWVDNFLRMVNWPMVEERYLLARKMRVEHS